MSETTCRKCSEPIELVGGDWATGDGTTCCYADLCAPYMPHEPVTVKEA